jgi:hypothetical protein
MVAKVNPVRAQALPKQDGSRDKPPRGGEQQQQQQQQQQQPQPPESLGCSPDKEVTRADSQQPVSEEPPPPGKAGDTEQGHGTEVPSRAKRPHPLTSLSPSLFPLSLSLSPCAPPCINNSPDAK